MDIPWKNLTDPIFRYAKARPSAFAIHEGTQHLTYGDLADLIGKATVYIHDLGIKRGEFVGISLPTNVDHVVLLLSLLQIGAIPVDVPLRRPPTPDPLTRFGITRAFADRAGSPPSADVVHWIDSHWRASIAGNAGSYRWEGAPDDTLLFSLTSGSTGEPKGIITTQRQWAERFQSACRLLPDVLTADRPPNLILVGDISFSGTFFFLMNQFFIGGPTVLLGANFDADYIVKNVSAWEDTAVLLISPVCRQLLSKAPSDAPLFPKARAVFVGAAPIFPEEKRSAAKLLSPNLYEIYGSAACGFISVLLPGEIAEKADTQGRLAPGITVEVADRKGNRLPGGAVGHIRCRGPGVSKGFYGPDTGGATGPEGFAGGWYFPGDVGSMDATGYLQVRGRLSDIVVRGSVEIFPPEIEEVLLAHPSVVEAAVLAVPVPGKGDQLFAFVVSSGELKLDELADHCRNLISGEKLPNRLFRAETLPKTSIGKLDRPALRTAVLRSLGSQPSSSRESD